MRACGVEKIRVDMFDFLFCVGLHEQYIFSHDFGVSFESQFTSDLPIFFFTPILSLLPIPIRHFLPTHPLSAPPSRIRFYGTDGDLLLSAGQDRALRLVALRRDEQSVELSQGSLAAQAKKLNTHADELRLAPVVWIVRL